VDTGTFYVRRKTPTQHFTHAPRMLDVLRFNKKYKFEVV
jgi:hypothetical protein